MSANRCTNVQQHIPDPESDPEAEEMEPAAQTSMMQEEISEP